MSADDLVVRLQATLNETEAIAREAAKYSADEWTTASSAVLDLGIPDLDGLIPLPASPIGHHMERNDPRAILRLVQSHRDILNLYSGAQFTQSCHPEYEGNNGYVKAMEQTIAALARGYGLEVT